MRNVVLLCLDSVRADVFANYASRLGELADVTVQQCRAASSWSTPSHASMLSGELPTAHGVHTHDRRFEKLSRARTVLGDLPSHRSLGVSANVFAGSEYGFDSLFDEFVDVSDTRRYPEAADPAAVDSSGLSRMAAFLSRALGSGRPLRSVANGVVGYFDRATSGRPVPKPFDDGATAVVRTARNCIRESREPFFLFANFMEAHTPLEHVRGFDRSLHTAPNRFTTDEYSVWELICSDEDHGTYLTHRRDLYAAAVDYLDRVLVEFVDWVDASTDRETTVVVTADHGENLGYDADDGLVRHKSSLSEGLLHVPLVLINPPEGYPECVDEYVSHLELRRMLAEVAAGETPDVTRDRVVAEVVGMSAGPEPPSRLEYWDRSIRAAFEGERKYIWDSLGNTAEYELDHGVPCWQRRRASGVDVPEWATESFLEDAATAKQRAVATEREDDVDAATRRRLDRLGYL